MNRKDARQPLVTGKFFSLATLASLLFAQSGMATFQSSSQFDQHSEFEQNVRTANPPGQTQPQPNPYKNSAYYGERSERQYYEEVTPTNNEEDRNYLLQGHPLQEAPLPRNRV